MAEPVDVVRAFNDAITRRDLPGLVELMTEDHVFTDTAGQAVVGRTACAEAWRGFFDAFGDYRNEFTCVEECGDVVVAAGRSHCGEPALAGPALWSARVAEGRVASWQVHEDTADNRVRLGIR